VAVDNFKGMPALRQTLVVIGLLGLSGSSRGLPLRRRTRGKGGPPPPPPPPPKKLRPTPTEAVTDAATAAGLALAPLLLSPAARRGAAALLDAYVDHAAVRVLFSWGWDGTFPEYGLVLALDVHALALIPLSFVLFFGALAQRRVDRPTDADAAATTKGLLSFLRNPSVAVALYGAYFWIEHATLLWRAAAVGGDSNVLRWTHACMTPATVVLTAHLLAVLNSRYPWPRIGYWMLLPRVLLHPLFLAFPFGWRLSRAFG